MAITFNFITNKEGIKILIQELLDTFGNLKYRDRFENIHSIDNAEDFAYDYFQPVVLYPKSMEEIVKEDDFSGFFSPALEYHVMFNRIDPHFCSGELRYFAGNDFPDFKEKIQRLFKRMKRKCKKMPVKGFPYFNLTDEELSRLLSVRELAEEELKKSRMNK